jgi:hypothetical protein
VSGKPCLSNKPVARFVWTVGWRLPLAIDSAELGRKKRTMKTPRTLFGWRRTLSLIVGLTFGGLAWAPATPKDPPSPAQAKPANAKPGGLVPLMLDLPQAAFKGTPKDLKVGPNVEPPPDPAKPRPPMMVPAGLKNLALGAKITCSDKNASADMLAKIIDGNKEASDESIIFLRKGTQWVQLDLGSVYETFAIALWHAHNTAKVYHAVIVQTADDPDFIQNVRTLFNNDQDNTSGLGVGTDREYFETNEGKLIDAKGAKARYFRFYSKGSIESAMNEYTEIELYGRPPAIAAAEKSAVHVAASSEAK